MLITQRVSIRYQIQFDVPFHFGTGLRNGLIHRSIARNTDGFLYVPGSTLKGVLRERSEQIARLFNLDVCELHGHGPDEANPIPDIVASIFGSRFYPGQIFFDDAQLIEEQRTWFEPNTGNRRIDSLRRDEFRSWQTEKRTQVSLSRLLGTAEKGRLYTNEYGVSSLCFVGRIDGALTSFVLSEEEGTSTSYASLLLVAALQSLDGEAIGGNKSTGAGRMRLEITNLQIADTPVNVPDLLTQLENLEIYWLEVEEARA